jgi:UDP-N-acetylglucosamine acyltransferase
MTDSTIKISPSAQIHPSAIISDGAVIGNDVIIGPYCVIGKDVTLDEGVRLISHICVDGITHIGAHSLIYPFASIGHNPQDLKYNGEPSTVTIGKNTTIREYVTIQPGTASGGMKTTVGNNCLLMVGVHVAHDCHVGNNVVMANYATLAGHVIIGDHVIIGGLSAIKQFVRVGAYAMIGGMSGVEKDVVPYAMVLGERANLHGVNIVGMKRHGFSNAVIQQVQSIYKNVFNEDDDAPFNARVVKQRDALNMNGGRELSETATGEVATQTLFDFMDGDTKCHFCMPKSGRG